MGIWGRKVRAPQILDVLLSTVSALLAMIQWLFSNTDKFHKIIYVPRRPGGNSDVLARMSGGRGPLDDGAFDLEEMEAFVRAGEAGEGADLSAAASTA